MQWDVAANFAIAVLAILNPLGKIPVWAELTGDTGLRVRARIAGLTVLTAGLLLSLFVLAGRGVLELFGIDLAAFRIAGGILILIAAVGMLQGRLTQLDEDEEEADSSPLGFAIRRFRRIVTPMVVPMLAGPGALTTVLIYSSRADGWMTLGVMCAIVAGVMGLTWLALVGSAWLERRVDGLVFTVITRVFGIILAALAVQFVLEGLAEAFPAWTGTTSSPVQNESADLR